MNSWITSLESFLSLIASLFRSGEAQYEEAIFRLVTALAQKLSESSDWQDEVEKFSRTLWMDFGEGRRACFEPRLLSLNRKDPEQTLIHHFMAYS